jgi:hypothetical protein
MAGQLTIDSLKASTGVLATQNGMTGICKSWVNINGASGASPTIRASFNVSSVTRNGTGDYTINFTTSMADANYVVAGSAALNGTGSGGSLNAARFIGQYSATTSACRVVACYANVLQDDPAYVQVAILGN